MIKAAVLFLAAIAAIAIARQLRNKFPGGGFGKPGECPDCGRKIVGKLTCPCRKSS